MGGQAMSIHVPIPGTDDLMLEHLILDVNGTLTDRGEPIVSAIRALQELRRHLTLHLLSADTFGTAGELAATVGAEYCQAATGHDKREDVVALGAEHCVAVGNGRNDALMLDAAALGIAVLGPEGLHRSALSAADVCALSIDEALSWLLEPRVLTATLRP
jgi:soluble P-type ATPase